MLWPVVDVRRFVEDQLRIQPGRSVKGRFFNEHSEVYDYLVGRGIGDIQLVHCDAHADLGFGGFSMRYILEDLLALPPEARNTPRRGGDDGLSSSNWLSFLLAARRVGSVVFVTPPQWDGPQAQDDLPREYFKDQDPKTGIIALPRLPKNGWGKWVTQRCLQEVISLEPEVPFARVRNVDFVRDSPPDLMLVTHSPLYVPDTADHLLDVLSDYVETSD